MNYDRLLTRVYDKQEKKMIYKYQKFVYDGVWYVFESVTNDAVIASEYNPISGVCQIICLELEDRFVPMQCWGLPDKNKKLIYEDDITRIVNTGEIAVIKCVRQLGDTKKPIILNLCPAIQYPAAGREFHFGTDPNNLEIIGNTHENPELKEQDE